MTEILIIDWSSLAPEVEALLAAGLSQVELQRAHRFKQDIDRRAYIVGHSFARAACAHAAGHDAASLRLEADSFGRPLFAQLRGRVDFNLSHSGTRCAVAVTTEDRIGVDIEALRDIELADVLHFLTAEEVAFVSEARGDVRRERLFIVWTALEAFAKMAGFGLDERLRTRTFTVEGDRVHLGLDNTGVPVTAVASFRIGDYRLAVSANPGLDLIEPRLLYL